MSLGNFAARISICRLKPGQKNSWTNVEVGPSGVDPQDLQDIISAKHARITSYLRKCSQVWLLIVADAAHISSIGDIDDSVRDYEYTSGFDRIIFYDAFNKKVVLIKE